MPVYRTMRALEQTIPIPKSFSTSLLHATKIHKRPLPQKATSFISKMNSQQTEEIAKGMEGATQQAPHNFTITPL